MASNPDWTVIGAGLAGSLTCLELVRRQQKVRWISDSNRPASSQIAAGMYNPITGKRFAKTWQVDVLQPFMETYYRELEQETGLRFLFPQPVIKLFTDAEEQGRWEARKDDADFQRLARPLNPELHPAGIRNLGLGGFLVPSAGSVRVPNLLEAVRGKLAETVDIQNQSYAPNRDLSGPVIHCTGWHGMENPHFQHIPFRHAHGDLLTILAPGLGETYIVNSGVYILPLGENRFRVGATYDWDRLNPNPTDDGRIELESRLNELLDTPYEVIGHSAGIRPATKRRTPILGRLPDHPEQLVFNGLGSKGVLLAPYYARHLVEHILNGKALDRDVDLLTHLK